MQNIKNRFVNTIDNLLCTALVIIIIIYLPVFFQMDFLNVFQESVEDFYVTDLFYYGGRDDVEKDTNIVLVNISNKPRNITAAQLNIINRYNPKVVAIDAFFRDSKTVRLDTVLLEGDNTFLQCDKCFIKNVNPIEGTDSVHWIVDYDPVDPQLVEAIENSNNLVLACKLIKPRDGVILTFDSVEYSHKKFRSNSHLHEGFVNMNLADDEFRTTREFTYRKKVKDTICDSYAFLTAMLYDSVKTQKLLDRGNDKEIINYKRNFDKYTTLEWDEVFKKQDSLQFLKDKIVIIGFLGPDLETKVTEDNFFTPLNDKIYGKSDPDMYGPVIHANIISTILEEDYIDNMFYWKTWMRLGLCALVVLFNMFLMNIVRIHYENWYEPASLAIMIVELFGILALILFVYANFNYEIKNRALLYSIILSGTIFETYHGSLKPLFRSLLRKLKILPQKR